MRSRYWGADVVVLSPDAAHRVVREAVRAGRLFRPDVCESCGCVPGLRSDGRPAMHGHHRDYGAPLSVVWLCSSCHGIEHGRIVKGLPVLSLPFRARQMEVTSE